MRPTNHLLVSSAIGVGVWIGTGEIIAIPIAAGAGTLADGDHLSDMIWHHYFHNEPTAKFALHAWEWLVAMLVTGVVLGFPWWLIALIAGYLSHVSTNHMANKGQPLRYSILYRSSQKFKFDRIFDGGTLRHPMVALLQEARIKLNDDSDALPNNDTDKESLV